MRMRLLCVRELSAFDDALLDNVDCLIFGITVSHLACLPPERPVLNNLKDRGTPTHVARLDDAMRAHERAGKRMLLLKPGFVAGANGVSNCTALSIRLEINPTCLMI